MEGHPKVTWVIGGLQSSSTPWNGPPGRTGFVFNRRRIEEPNVVCDAIKRYLREGYLIKVETCGVLLGDLDEVIDEILVAHHLEMTEDGLVQVTFLPRGSWADWDRCPWMLLDPRGRLSRHETWVKNASFLVASTADD